MSAVTDSLKAGAGVAVLAILGGLSYRALYGTASRQGVWATVLASTQTQQGFAILSGADDGGNLVAYGLGPDPDSGAWPAQVYGRVKVCAYPIDGGVDPGPSLIPGTVIVYDDDGVAACDSSEPTVQAWADGYHGTDGGVTPWLCACPLSLDAGACLVALSDGGQAQAVPGLTINPGLWSGPGCRPKSCRELSGLGSWPASCPLQ